MSRRVVVIGAGVAGVAAAWSASRRGADVTIVDGGAGASVFGGGAVDDLPWEERARAAQLARRLGDGAGRAAAPLDADVAAFVDALRLWVIGGEPVLLATVAGRVRPARGRDAALLDLASLRRGTVIVPRVDRAGWEAESLARALSAEPAARAAGLVFVATDATVLRRTHERLIADADLAACHDADERIAWLAEHLRRAVAKRPDATAVLLGPWLGGAAPRAATLTARLGLPVGEALVGVGGAAGIRMRAALERVVAEAKVSALRCRAARLSTSADRLRVTFEDGGATESVVGKPPPIAADSVVLAIGGLVGGGLRYTPPDHEAGEDLPPAGAVSFATSLAIADDLGAALVVRGRRLDVGSSLHGPTLDATAWPTPAAPGVLEAVGLRADAALARRGVHVAGDAVADRPRTLLEAVATGVAAGIAAAG